MARSMVPEAWLVVSWTDFLEFAQALKTVLTRTSQAFDGLFHDDFLEFPQGRKRFCLEDGKLSP